MMKISDSNFDEIVRVLKAGGLIMHPTETCYGLAVDIFNKEAIEKLYRFKGMSFDKPVSILVDSIGMANEYGIFSDKANELAMKYWPGPLSIVVPRTRNLPEFLNPGQEFVSIRFSSDEFCTEMVSALGRPVTTTSANKTGMPQLYEADVSVFGEDGGKIDLVVDGGKIIENKPSTIVKVDGEEVEILRQGDLVVE